MSAIITTTTSTILTLCVSRYECRAKSNNGEATAAGYLEIKSVTTIVNGPGEVTKTVGDTIVMKCDVVAGGDLDLKVTWKKDNLDIELNDRIQQNEDHSLTIQNLTFDDSGRLECFIFLTQFYHEHFQTLLKVFIINSNRNYKEIKFATK